MDQHRLFIAKLPLQITNVDLEEHFTHFGEVIDVFLPSVNAIKETKIAFVSFANEQGQNIVYTYYLLYSMVLILFGLFLVFFNGFLRAFLSICNFFSFFPISYIFVAFFCI